MCVQLPWLKPLGPSTNSAENEGRVTFPPATMAAPVPEMMDMMDMMEKVWVGMGGEKDRVGAVFLGKKKRGCI